MDLAKVLAWHFKVNEAFVTVAEEEHGGQKYTHIDVDDLRYRINQPLAQVEQALSSYCSLDHLREALAASHELQDCLDTHTRLYREQQRAYVEQALAEQFDVESVVVVEAEEKHSDGRVAESALTERYTLIGLPHIRFHYPASVEQIFNHLRDSDCYVNLLDTLCRTYEATQVQLSDAVGGSFTEEKVNNGARKACKEAVIKAPVANGIGKLASSTSANTFATQASDNGESLQQSLAGQVDINCRQSNTASIISFA